MKILSDLFFFSIISLSVGAVWVNSYSVFDPCLPISGHKASGTCTDGGQEVGFNGLSRVDLTFGHCTFFSSCHVNVSPLFPSNVVFSLQFFFTHISNSKYNIRNCAFLNIRSQSEESLTSTSFVFYQGLYQFLRPPSFSINQPHSSFISMDYSKFGSGSCPVVIPNDLGAR